ncbi:MAG: ABC transporter substrate-binding protein [Clostridia bacterium]|nr:ABC transporter substrate-binding protein [Clostridia bacterium]
MLKKIILAVMIFSLVVITAGCGGDKVANSGDVPIVKWLIYANSPKNPEPVLEKVNEILVEKVGAKLEIEFIDTGAYSEKMNTYMAASYDYDLAFAGAGNPLVNAASKGGIQPLDKYLAEMPELKAAIPDYAWELVKYQGEIYGVPNLQVLPTARAALCKVEILEKYGRSMDEFKTLDDLVPFLEEMKQTETDPEFFALSPTRDGATLEALGYCDDYARVDNVYFKKAEDGTWKATYKYELPEYRKQVEKMYDFYKNGYIRKDIVSAEGSTVGKAGITFSVYKPGIEAVYKGQGLDLNAAVIEKPVIEKCQALTVLGKDSKHPVEALKILLEVNTNKELFNLLTLGIEGVHYEMVDDNTFRYIGDNTTNDYWINGAWRFGNQFNSYVQEGAEADVWEQTAAYNESAEISPFIGFAIDNKPIRTELAQLETLISRYSVMNVGAQNPDEYYDKFLAELKTAGSEKVAAEYERQVNEFLSK